MATNNNSDSEDEGVPTQARRVPTMEERRNLPHPHPPPRYTWYRPRMQGFPGEINSYNRINVLQGVMYHLIRIGGQDLLGRFANESPFGKVLALRKVGNAKRALHELLARELWRGEEHEFERLFHVGGRDIRFGPQEFCLVTGLCFGPTTFNPHGRNHVIPQSSLFHTYFSGRQVQVKELLNHFKDASIVIGTPDQYLSAANLIVYYYVLLSRDPDRHVDDWAWTLVEDPQRWAEFPWGSWSFQIMCHQLGVAKKDPTEMGGQKNRGAYHLYGPVWAMFIWAVEAIPALGQAIGVRRNEHLMPRLRRWELGSSNADFVDFFDNPELEVNPTLEPDEEERTSYYFQSLFECQDPLQVRFNPNTRHSWKKAPPEQRQTKDARDMARVIDKLRCRDSRQVGQPQRRHPRATRANSEGGAPIPANIEFD